MPKIDLSEIKLWKVFASLGIPGIALGVFYFLFRRFNFLFPEVPVGWVGPIVALFMILASVIVFYALMRWAPASGVATVRITVLGPDNMPVENSKIKPSIGGETKKVDGGWELELAISKLPDDQKITIYAEQKQTNLFGQREIVVKKRKLTATSIQLKQKPKTPKKKIVSVPEVKIGEMPLM